MAGNLPSGTTDRDIDRAAPGYDDCTVCGEHIDDCRCDSFDQALRDADRLRALLHDVLERCFVPADLRRRIAEMLP